MVSTPRSRVELTLSARGLADKDTFSKSDPMCVVDEYRPRQGNPSISEWKEIGRTEVIKNILHPEWNKKIELDYYFESKQDIRFRIFDVDNARDDLNSQDYLGHCECVLADIVAAPERLLVLKLKGCGKADCGQFVVRADEIDEGQKEIVRATIHGLSLELSKSKIFHLHSLLFSDGQPFFELHRPTSDMSRALVYRSEPCKVRTRNPEFPPFELTLQQLCGHEANKNSQLYIDFFETRNDGSHKQIGAAETSLNALLNMIGNKQVPLINKRRQQKRGANKYTDSGKVRIVSLDVQRVYSFLDFITAGMQIEFAVAIDFTASNGIPGNPKSLHFLNQYAPNQYEMAIRAVLDVCQSYNRSKQFEATGFGAILLPSRQLSDLFPLHLSDNYFTVAGVDGVMNAYRMALNSLELHGPTNFSPTIRYYVDKTSRFVRDGSRYQVLLIITDGLITDMENTIRAIIDASIQPLSIIIVGVGTADFNKMDVLDSDKVPLADSHGRRAKRDIVQFVPFRNFINAVVPDGPLSVQQREYVQAQLAKEVLAELPEQVTSFMRSNGISPAAITSRMSTRNMPNIIYR